MFVSMRYCLARFALALVVAVSAELAIGQSPDASQPVSVDVSAGASITAQDLEFLDGLQKQTFDYFWKTTPSNNGLVLDRWPSQSPASIAAIGFGLTSYGVGVDRGWISRDEAAQRVATTLDTLYNLPQGPEPNAAGYKGFFYHFLHPQTGERWQNCELSSMDTALLMAGVLFCQQYFDADNSVEQAIRERAQQLYDRVEWTWMQPRAPLMAMGWKPETGFDAHDYRGYSEAMLLYVLALGSPQFAIAPAAWEQFTATYVWGNFYGEDHVNFGPLFGHQYSHVWIDFRKIQDPYMAQRGIDYFENSRRATHSHRSYATANPRNWRDIDDKVWGTTACDGPVNGKFPFEGDIRQFTTYSARGTSSDYDHDDGTVAPTAAGGSVAFAPEIAIPAMREMESRYGTNLRGDYGFYDSFNPSFRVTEVETQHGKVCVEQGWFANDYIGIDQGPILLMAENLRSGMVWNRMRKSAAVVNGLRRAGFAGGWLAQAGTEVTVR